MTWHSWLPPAIAFVLATSIAALELITSKYPRTAYFLRKSWRIYVYSTIYGVISLCAYFVLPDLLAKGTIKIEEGALPSSSGSAIVTAFLVGLSSKALMHIRLFSISTGSGTTFPVGVESFVQLFEPWLLEGIGLDEFTGLRSYVRQRLAKHNDIAVVKKAITDNLPNHIAPEPFKVDLERITEPIPAFELYFRKCGKTLFDMVFPP